MVLLSGCVAELLGSEDQTTRNVACALLSTERAATINIHVHGAVEGVEAWVGEVASASGRERAAFTIHNHPATPVDDVWLAAQLGLNDDVHMRFVVVPELEEGLLGDVARPGIVLISQAAIDAGVGTTVLLHFAGHAMGVVNAGVAMNHTATEGREAPAHHEPSSRSVLYAGWHRLDSMPKTNATYDGYSAAVRDDLAAARGVCP